MKHHDPAVTLGQILDHARRIEELTRERAREDLDKDPTLALAIERLLHIIGEAATRLPEAEREARPDIPWREIIGLRHRLVHAYDEVDLTILWRIVQKNVPVLIERLSEKRSCPPRKSAFHPLSTTKFRANFPPKIPEISRLRVLRSGHPSLVARPARRRGRDGLVSIQQLGRHS